MAGTTDNEFFTYTGLDPGVSYSLSVSSFDEASNESARSLALSVSTLNEIDSLPPSVPTGLEIIEVMESSISLKWSASTDDIAAVLNRPSGTVRRILSESYRMLRLYLREDVNQ